MMCRWVTSVPVDGYPGGRVTEMPDRGQNASEERARRSARKGRQGANASYSRIQPRAFASTKFSSAHHTEGEESLIQSRISPFRIQIKQVQRRNPKDHCKTPVSHHPLNRKTCPSSSPPCAAVQPPSQNAPSQRVNLPSSRA